MSKPVKKIEVTLTCAECDDEDKAFAKYLLCNRGKHIGPDLNVTEVIGVKVAVGGQEWGNYAYIVEGWSKKDAWSKLLGGFGACVPEIFEEMNR